MTPLGLRTRASAGNEANRNASGSAAIRLAFVPLLPSVSLSMSSTGGSSRAAGAERAEGKVQVVHRMEGYFDKLKSKKNLGSDFNKRYFAVVRTPDKRFCLNYYGKRSDLADENCRPSGSIPLKEITYVGVPGQSVEDGGQPGFKVGDPGKLAKKKKKKPDDTILAHNPIMEEYAARGIQIGSLNQNIFIVATNKSMAQKWIAGLCFMRNLRLPPGTGWPKKFGPPPPCLFKADKNGKLKEAAPEEAKPLAGYFNSVVVEKGVPILEFGCASFVFSSK